VSTLDEKLSEVDKEDITTGVYITAGEIP